jgi:hypothetical protein
MLQRFVVKEAPSIGAFLLDGDTSRAHGAHYRAHTNGWSSQNLCLADSFRGLSSSSKPTHGGYDDRNERESKSDDG